MTVMTAVLGLALILGVLYEAFETMLLPRRVARSFRLTRLFYLHSWRLWTAMAAADRHGPSARDVPQLLRPPLAAGPAQPLGARG